MVTGIPMNTKVVIRSRYTDTQTHKGQYARWENVRNLFACIFPDGLEGKHLLLVDDVLTTRGYGSFLALMPFVAYPDYVSVYLLWHWQGNLDNNNYFLVKITLSDFSLSRCISIFLHNIYQI
mgnify:CR=1 FL=1